MNAVPIVLAAAGLGAIALFAASEDESSSRTIHLIQGVRYAIAVRLQVGWSADQFPGFCNFSDPAITAEGPGWGEVQFTAEWCSANQPFSVPDNMAISRVAG